MRGDPAEGCGAVAIAAALVAMTACDGGAAAAGVAVTDSAGVRIVQLAELPDAPLPWILAPEPAVVIGGAATDPRAELVRVTGAARRSDGRIVVADGGASEVRLFKPDGAPAGAFGRSGGGPGEFGRMYFFRLLPGDSALVYDAQHRRFTVVTPGLALARTYQPAAAGVPAMATAEAMFVGGPVVARGPGTFGGDMPSTGTYDGSAPILLLGSDGEVRDTLGVFPHRTSFLRVGDGSIEIVRLPIGARTAWAEEPDRVHVGTARRFEILTFSRAGDLLRILRSADLPPPVTSGDVERLIESAVAAAPEERRPGIRAMYDEVPMPERMPAHGEIVADAAGNLWVQRFTPDPDVTPTWMVFDSAGAPLGTVDTPVGVRVLEIGVDYVLGSGADELDRPYLGVWPLSRGEDRGP